MKKRLFLFTLVFALMFTSFAFANDYNFDSDFSWIYDRSYINVNGILDDNEKLDIYNKTLNCPCYVYFKYKPNSDYDYSYVYLASDSPINEYSTFIYNNHIGGKYSAFKFISDSPIYVIRVVSPVFRSITRYPGGTVSFTNNKDQFIDKVIDANSDIYYKDSDDVFFSQPLTPLQQVAPEIFPLVKKQVGGITLGTVCLISVPILLILLGRLFRRWLIL